ncbi:MAG TPA: substrate-binding domain-containing protein [Trebonia sp.]
MRKVDPAVDEAIETLNMKDGPSRRRLLSGAGLFSATAAASALISACTSSSSTSAAVKSGSGSKNPFPQVPGQQYWFVNHADTNEFFTPTKYGYSDAAALLGIPTPNWGGDPNSVIANMVTYFNQAVSAKAAGIALASISDTSFTQPVSSAMSAGIPVITYNADGIYKSGVPSIGTNRLAYVGQALYISGQQMGEQIKTLIPGGGEVVIFIATPGTGNIQPRYDGAVSVLGSNYKVHEIATTTDTSLELSKEKAFLLGNKQIKGAFAVDSGSTSFLGTAIKEAGMTIPSGGFDTAPQTLSDLQSGALSFSIYQDPYLQGFLPTLFLYLYNLSGGQLAPPDTDTGLTILNKGNVTQFTKSSRYQGGSSGESYIPRPSGAINQPQATTST